MKSQCKAKTKRGTRCPNPAGPSGYCFSHDPAQSKARAAAHKRGGQNRHRRSTADISKVPAEIRDVPGVLALLDVAARDALALDLSTGRVKALCGVALAFLKAFEVGEFEQRLELIERALNLNTPHGLNGAQHESTAAAIG